jgi:hypothetical protein
MDSMNIRRCRVNVAAFALVAAVGLVEIAPFATNNLISNEAGFQQVIPALTPHAHRGAYLGVGPEQNLTYIHNKTMRNHSHERSSPIEAPGLTGDVMVTYTPTALSAASTRPSLNGTRRSRTPVAS